MTVDGGTRIDSRQPIADDPECRVMRTCLGASLLWWLTVISVVEPILSDAGDDAFALVLGFRTLLDLQGDGSVRRTRLRAMVPGGLTSIKLVRTGINEALPPGVEPAGSMDPSWTGESMGEVGLIFTEPRCPWRVLDGNEYYLAQAGPTLRPTVIVDTTDSVLHDGSFESLRRRRLFDERVVLVIPHTHAAERLIKAYPDHVRAGRTISPLAGAVVWDPLAPPDPIRYTTPVPVSADFRVSGLMRGNAWQDPSDLEAARSLLQARFDLRIGIWDLVQNPVLRRTLLESPPSSSAPKRGAAVPLGAATRASRVVAERIANKTRESSARAQIDRQIGALISTGWTQTQHGYYRLSMAIQKSALVAKQKSAPLAMTSAVSSLW